MEDPARDITKVYSLITMPSSAQAQRAAVERYFTPEAGFMHPMVKVLPGPGSRERILGIHQYYHIVSTGVPGDLAIRSVLFNREHGILDLEVIQRFHLRFSPFKAKPARLLVRLTLQKHAGLHYISMQEDFYHPEDLVSLFLPPLIPLISLFLIFGAYVCSLGAQLGVALGFSESAKPKTAAATHTISDGFESEGTQYDSDEGLYDSKRM